LLIINFSVFDTLPSAAHQLDKRHHNGKLCYDCRRQSNAGMARLLPTWPIGVAAKAYLKVV